MPRRKNLAALTKLALCVFALSVCICSCSRQPRKPNIIFILADDLGYGDLGCYGQNNFKTPNIDRMAAEGLRFTDFYASSPVCAPSRASLMTGYHTGHSRVRGNYETGPHGFGACLELRPQDLTITEIAKQQGYTTGVYGKWSLGVMTTTGQPDKKGVDEFFGYLNQANAHFYYADCLWKNGKRFEIEENKDGKRGKYTHDLIVDESLDFIKRHKNELFFLYLPWTLPHAELLVPEDSILPYRGIWPETLHYRENDPSREHYSTPLEPKATYAGMVSRLDRDVGRVLELLSELDLEENTLVIFSSDNGPHHEGGHDPDFFDSNGKLRGIKRDLYEGGIRVPMIARWPGKILPGSTDYISAFWDVLPTVCDVIGASTPKEIDGISFLPTLLDEPEKQKQHDYLYWEFHENPTTSQAVRTGNWKAVRLAPSGPIELYDLSLDIGEENDVALEHPDIVAKAKNLLSTTRTQHEIWPLKDTEE